MGGCRGSPRTGVAVPWRVVYKERHDFESVAEEAEKRGKTIPRLPLAVGRTLCWSGGEVVMNDENNNEPEGEGAQRLAAECLKNDYKGC